MWTFYNKLGNQLRLQKGGTGCLIATGQYVGDGSTSKAITGVGFRPKWVKIFATHPAGEENKNQYEKLDQSWGDLALLTYGGCSSASDNRINSLDEDGFTVDDNGIDEHPNQNGATYDWIAFGYGVAGDWPVWDQVVKGWIQFNGTGTIAIQDSYNVSSIVDNTAGNYTVNWDTDFANDDYAVIAQSNHYNTYLSTIAVGSALIGTADNSYVPADAASVSVIAIGDQ